MIAEKNSLFPPRETRPSFLIQSIALNNILKKFGLEIRLSRKMKFHGTCFQVKNE